MAQRTPGPVDRSDELNNKFEDTLDSTFFRRMLNPRKSLVGPLGYVFDQSPLPNQLNTKKKKSDATDYSEPYDYYSSISPTRQFVKNRLETIFNVPVRWQMKQSKRPQKNKPWTPAQYFDYYVGRKHFNAKTSEYKKPSGTNCYDMGTVVTMTYYESVDKKTDYRSVSDPFWKNVEIKQKPLIGTKKIARAVKKANSEAWVDGLSALNSGHYPKPGDYYALLNESIDRRSYKYGSEGNDSGNDSVTHVGVILEVNPFDTTQWITVDLGQGGGHDGQITHRTFNPEKLTLSGKLGSEGTARGVLGWVDFEQFFN